MHAYIHTYIYIYIYMKVYPVRDGSADKVPDRAWKAVNRGRMTQIMFETFTARQVGIADFFCCFVLKASSASAVSYFSGRCLRLDLAASLLRSGR